MLVRLLGGTDKEFVHTHPLGLNDAVGYGVRYVLGLEDVVESVYTLDAFSSLLVRYVVR